MSSSSRSLLKQSASMTEEHVVTPLVAAADPESFQKFELIVEEHRS
jgi:hypothetical protein